MAVDEGRSAVVREAIGAAGAELAADRAAAAGEQLAMFPVPTRFTGLRAAHVQRALEQRHAPGRPAGAQNLSTRQFREFLLGRGKSPLVSLMEFALHTPTSLAAELGCTRLEAFRELRTVWAELAPYLHARVQPTDDQGQAVPFFQLVMGGQNVAIAGGAPPWAYIEQKQGLSEPADPVSHDEKSHEGGK